MKKYRRTDSAIVGQSICDKCDNPIEDDQGYNLYDFEMYIETGEMYPEGGYGEKLSLELCKKCSQEAFSILNSNGFKVQVTDWES